MQCKCGSEGVLNTALGKPFYYCRSCKIEIGLEIPTTQTYGSADNKILGWTSLYDGRYKDSKTGLIWGPIQSRKFDHYKAQYKFGSDLPTIEEFLEAEKHGIRDVFRMKGRYFWSASVHPDKKDDAYYFSGDDGYTYPVFRKCELGSVVLVER